MSDPAKSSEIEDVLASIRRLVSVDPTGGLKTQRGAVTQKLVLTSDLRVSGGRDGAKGGPAEPLRLEASAAAASADLPDDADETDDVGENATLGEMADGRVEDPSEPANAAADDDPALEIVMYGADLQHGAAEDDSPTGQGDTEAAAESALRDGDGEALADAHSDEADPPATADDAGLGLAHADETFEFDMSDRSDADRSGASGPDDVDKVAGHDGALNIDEDGNRSGDMSLDGSDADSEQDDPVYPAGLGPTLEARIAELEAAVSSQGAEFEPDGSEDLRQHRPERVPTRRPAPSAETEDAIAQLVSDAASSIVRHARNADGSIPAGDADASASRTGDRSALFGRASTSLADPATSDTDTGTDAETQEPLDQDDFAEAIEAASATDDPLAADGALELVTELGAPGDRAAEPVADDGVDASSFDAAHGMDYRETDDDEGDGEGAILDEAALRELVSDIVRSELQGALGERITRNVRKLVRREIMRAITVRDME